MKLIEDKNDAYVLGGCMGFAFIGTAIGIPFWMLLISACLIGLAAALIIKDPKG